MKRVFLIGNGTSRDGFDLEQLRPHGKIYGCNAIYRSGFLPDVMIAVDHGIMHEIYQANIAEKVPCLCIYSATCLQPVSAPPIPILGMTCNNLIFLII